MSLCEDPKWLKMMHELQPYANQLEKLHPGSTSDLGTHWTLDDDTGKPCAVAVEYRDEVYVYSWDGKKLKPASAELFFELWSGLPQYVRKREAWTNPCERKNGKSQPTAWRRQS